MARLNYGSHYIDEADIARVVEALRGPLLTQGPTTPKFEEAIASYCGAKFAAASNSATSSLHLACLSLGVGPSDLVWVSSVSFVASANCARYCGAEIDFIDISLTDTNLDTVALEKKLLDAEAHNRLPKVLIVVHMAGYSADMAKIAALCRPRGIRIIEDASHALGAVYNGQAVGCCSDSDIAVFSFHPVKMATTIEGGVATTNDPDLYDKLKLYGAHGIVRDADKFSSRPKGPLFYEQVALGYNYRLNDVQAALGLSQLEKLDGFLEKRRFIARTYFEQINTEYFDLPAYQDDRNPSFHLFIVRCRGNSPEARDRVLADLMNAEIFCNIHYIPIYEHAYHNPDGRFDRLNFPNANAYYAQALSLPIHMGLTDADLQFVVERLNAAGEKFCR